MIGRHADRAASAIVAAVLTTTLATLPLGSALHDSLEETASAAATAGQEPNEGPNEDTLHATVRPGTLTITTSGSGVDLGAGALDDTNGTLITARTELDIITVTDTRAGDLGYTLTGQVADFRSGAGRRIDAGGLGWTPRVVSAEPDQDITRGDVVAASSQGLAIPRTLAVAAPAGSLGTARFTAGLNLRAPASTEAGVYTAVLTLTVI